MAAHALRVAGGTRRFGARGHEFTVFQGLDLEVRDGELFVLLGPSGCGKSTLLRVIAGLDELDEGSVTVVEGAHGSGAGIVFQQPLLLPWLTVLDNVKLGLRYRANKHAADEGMVRRTLAEFGLIELAHAYPDELSGGQAQRVSLARTVVTDRRVVLLDEPFSALDPLTRRGLQQWLRQVQRDLGLSVLMVTHDVEEALLLGDRVALMSASPGRIERTWTVTESDRSADSLRDLREEVLQAYTDVATHRPPRPVAPRDVLAATA